MENYEKKYKNALEWARQVINGETGFIRKEVEEIFPELAESEDEKIRKEIIGIIRNAYWTSNRDRFNKLVAWLEKQKSVEEIVEKYKTSWYNEGKIDGKFERIDDDVKYLQGWHDAIEKQREKPQGKTALEAVKEEKVDNANKVEPKFHEGEWIVDNDDGDGDFFKVTKVREHTYRITGFGDEFDIQREVLEDNYHKFTIQDAKDGDVLSSNVLLSKYNKPFIYNGNHNSTHIGAYCGISTENRFNVATEKCRWTANVNIRPATKDQCDTLMKAMADAGYIFDFEKKELKNVEED